MRASPSKPRAHAGDELHIARIPAGFPHAIGGSPELPRPHDTDIGCELPPHLVTKTQAEFKVRQAGAQPACGIGFAVEVGLALGL